MFSEGFIERLRIGHAAMFSDFFTFPAGGAYQMLCAIHSSIDDVLLDRCVEIYLEIMIQSVQ